MAEDHGSGVKNDKQYEGLEKKGMSTVPRRRHRQLRRRLEPGWQDVRQRRGPKSASSQGGTTQQKKAAGRKGGKASANKS